MQPDAAAPIISAAKRALSSKSASSPKQPTQQPVQQAVVRRVLGRFSQPFVPARGDGVAPTMARLMRHQLDLARADRGAETRCGN